MYMPRHARSTGCLFLSSGLLMVLALTGCGSSDAASGSDKIAITASDTACAVATTKLDAGSTTFAVTNKGAKITEVYIYAEQGGTFSKVVGEVENVGPGTSRDLAVRLGGGSYEVACKPGQKGDGIRTKITAAGGKGDPSATSGSGASSSSAFDRELTFELAGTALTGGDGLTAKVGEKIEFKLVNNADGVREFEVLDPGGKIAEALDIAPGKSGEFVVTLSRAGSWTVKIEDGPSVITKPLVVS